MLSLKDTLVYTDSFKLLGYFELEGRHCSCFVVLYMPLGYVELVGQPCLYSCYAEQTSKPK